jgi:hypothetical protein
MQCRTESKRVVTRAAHRLIPATVPDQTSMVGDALIDARVGAEPLDHTLCAALQDFGGRR